MLLSIIAALNLIVFAITNLQLIIYIRQEGSFIRELSKSINRTAVYQRKATNTFLCITSVYFVCKLPICCFLLYNFIIGTWYPDKRDFAISVYFLYWAMLVQFMNSALNALIFTSKNKTVRKFYRKKFSQTVIAEKFRPEFKFVIMDCSKATSDNKNPVNKNNDDIMYARGLSIFFRRQYVIM